MGARRLRHRTKQHIHAGPVTVDRRAIGDVDHVIQSLASQDHVPVARRDQRAAAQHAIARGGFLHLDAATAIQTLGECRRETLRHVLHDQNAGGVFGQGLEHHPQTLSVRRWMRRWRRRRRRADAARPRGARKHHVDAVSAARAASLARGGARVPRRRRASVSISASADSCRKSRTPSCGLRSPRRRLLPARACAASVPRAARPEHTTTGIGVLGHDPAQEGQTVQRASRDRAGSRRAASAHLVERDVGIGGDGDDDAGIWE